MSSFSEHFHYRVLGALVDGVVPNALPQVLLNHLFWFNYSGGIARQAHAKFTRWHGTHPKRRCHGTNTAFCLVVMKFPRNISFKLRLGEAYAQSNTTRATNVEYYHKA